MKNEVLYLLLNNYADHEAVFLASAIACDERSIKENPKYMNKVVAPTLDVVRSCSGFHTLPDYPVGLIADATIANRIADLTIVVVRAGKLDRRQLPDIEKLYQEKKLKNMALVLNGANPERHGYGYSYGYGYGYGYRTKKKKTFF